MRVSSLLQRSVPSLIRAASACALVGLSVMCLSVLWPRALPVIFAMSVGHLIGGAAFAGYLLAIIVDARSSAAKVHTGQEPPASEPPSGAASPEPGPGSTS